MARRVGNGRSAWRRIGVAAVLGHLALVPLYFAARAWDLSRQPLGQGHWPGEPGWPTGSGSSDWRPGEVYVAAGWVVLVLLLGVAIVAAALGALERRLVPRPAERSTSLGTAGDT